MPALLTSLPTETVENRGPNVFKLALVTNPN